MDFAQTWSMVEKILAEERAVYHLTLGELRNALAKSPPGLPVVAEDMITGERTCLGRCESYRGYYEDLSFQPVDPSEIDTTNKVMYTVAALYSRCTAAIGCIYTGYKGGEFTMHENTALWLSNHGRAENIAMIGSLTKDDEFVILVKRVRDES